MGQGRQPHNEHIASCCYGFLPVKSKYLLYLGGAWAESTWPRPGRSRWASYASLTHRRGPELSRSLWNHCRHEPAIFVSRGGVSGTLDAVANVCYRARFRMTAPGREPPAIGKRRMPGISLSRTAGNLDGQITFVHGNFILRSGCCKADDQRRRQPESSRSDQAPAQTIQACRG